MKQQFSLTTYRKAVKFCLAAPPSCNHLTFTWVRNHVIVLTPILQYFSVILLVFIYTDREIDIRSGVVSLKN